MVDGPSRGGPLVTALTIVVGGTAALATARLVGSVRHCPKRLYELLPDNGWQRSRQVGVLRKAPVVFGRRLRALVGRAPDAAADRRWGLLAIGALVALLVHPVVGVGAMVSVFAVPVVRSRREARSRAEQVREQLPDVVDLFRLAIGAGLTVRLAVDAVAYRCGGIFADRLLEVQRRVVLGQRLTDALDALTDLGEPVRPLTGALIASERDGAPLGLSLERVATDARLLRRRAAEEAARRLPVKLLFPLVACILPAFFLLAVVPLLGGALGSLGL